MDSLAQRQFGANFVVLDATKGTAADLPASTATPPKKKKSGGLGIGIFALLVLLAYIGGRSARCKAV